MTKLLSLMLFSALRYQVKKAVASAPWQAQGDSRRGIVEESLYADLPTNVFAPSGRLLSVERILPLTTTMADTSSNLVVAIHCRDGVAVVASLPRSPYMYDPTHPKITNSSNTTAGNESTPPSLRIFDETSAEYSWNAPFCRLSTGLCGITGGNAIDSQILIDTLYDYAQGAREAMEADIFSSRVLARRLADRLQVKTQQAGKGRLLASVAIIVDVHEVWRVDPTGQFYKCRATAAGRGAREAEHALIKELCRRYEEETRKKADEDPTGQRNKLTIDPSQLHVMLSRLSTKEALALATQIVQSTIKGRADEAKNTQTSMVEPGAPSATRFEGFVIQSGHSAAKRPSITTYSENELQHLIDEQGDAP